MWVFWSVWETYLIITLSRKCVVFHNTLRNFIWNLQGWINWWLSASKLFTTRLENISKLFRVYVKINTRCVIPQIAQIDIWVSDFLLSTKRLGCMKRWSLCDFKNYSSQTEHCMFRQTYFTNFSMQTHLSIFKIWEVEFYTKFIANVRIFQKKKNEQFSW